MHRSAAVLGVQGRFGQLPGLQARVVGGRRVALVAVGPLAATATRSSSSVASATPAAGVARRRLTSTRTAAAVSKEPF